MPLVADYFRPDSLDRAVALLAEPNRRALGGGTVVVPEARRPTEQGVGLVDLQALGLEAVTVHSEQAELGAMARLGDLRADDRLPPLLRDLCRRELPSALRNQATIGGTVALGDPDSVLLAGLLVHDAVVSLHGEAGARELPLTDVLHTGLGPGSGAREAAPTGAELVTAATIMTTGTSAIAATGRTPADVPIVAAVARRHDADSSGSGSGSGGDGDGNSDGGDVILALTGVGPHPVLVDPADPTAGLSPTGDFRGSAEYRLHLAATLSARVIEEVSS